MTALYVQRRPVRIVSAWSDVATRSTWVKLNYASTGHAVYCHAGLSPDDLGWPDNWRVCLACGSPFVPTATWQRYCKATACQAERDNRNNRAAYRRRRVATEQ